MPFWVSNMDVGSIMGRECDRVLWGEVREEWKFNAVFKHSGEVLDWNNSRVVIF